MTFWLLILLGQQFPPWPVEYGDCPRETYTLEGDWAGLALALTGPLGPDTDHIAGENARCKYDRDGDLDLDLLDVAEFQNRFTPSPP